MTQTQEWDSRFMVVAASTMLDLVGMMNQVAHPFARCIYFGENKGDYSNTTVYTDDIRRALFIAVFDIAPMSVYPVEDFSVIEESTTSDLVAVDMGSALSA